MVRLDILPDTLGAIPCGGPDARAQATKQYGQLDERANPSREARRPHTSHDGTHPCQRDELDGNDADGREGHRGQRGVAVPGLGQQCGDQGHVQRQGAEQRGVEIDAGRPVVPC